MKRPIYLAFLAAAVLLGAGADCETRGRMAVDPESGEAVEAKNSNLVFRSPLGKLVRTLTKEQLPGSLPKPLALRKGRVALVVKGGEGELGEFAVLSSSGNVLYKTQMTDVVNPALSADGRAVTWLAPLDPEFYNSLHTLAHLRSLGFVTPPGASLAVVTVDLTTGATYADFYPHVVINGETHLALGARDVVALGPYSHVWRLKDGKTLWEFTSTLKSGEMAGVQLDSISPNGRELLLRSTYESVIQVLSVEDGRLLFSWEAARAGDLPPVSTNPEAAAGGPVCGPRYEVPEGASYPAPAPPPGYPPDWRERTVAYQVAQAALVGEQFVLAVLWPGSGFGLQCTGPAFAVLLDRATGRAKRIEKLERLVAAPAGQNALSLNAYLTHGPSGPWYYCPSGVEACYPFALDKLTQAP